MVVRSPVGWIVECPGCAPLLAHPGTGVTAREIVPDAVVPAIAYGCVKTDSTKVKRPCTYDISKHSPAYVRQALWTEWRIVSIPTLPS